MLSFVGWKGRSKAKAKAKAEAKAKTKCKSEMPKQKAKAESNLSVRCAFRVQTPKCFKASIELRVFGCGKNSRSTQKSVMPAQANRAEAAPLPLAGEG